MSTFQVVRLEPRAGIARVSQRPYNMLIVKGIFTNDEGVVDTAELVFMENQNRKLPVLTCGLTYEPVIAMYVKSDGKLTASVESLLPIKVAPVARAA